MYGITQGGIPVYIYILSNNYKQIPWHNCKYYARYKACAAFCDLSNEFKQKMALMEIFYFSAPRPYYCRSKWFFGNLHWNIFVIKCIIIILCRIFSSGKEVPENSGNNVSVIPFKALHAGCGLCHKNCKGKIFHVSICSLWCNTIPLFAQSDTTSVPRHFKLILFPW